jgi:ATP-dependent DNA helicase RecQ
VFEQLRALKTSELDKMIDYVETRESRMKFLCRFLGDSTNTEYSNCDNTGLEKIRITEDPVLLKKLEDFRGDYFPLLDVESAKSKIVNGVASSFYGVSNVGNAIHRSKYENGGEFPDFLLIQTLRAFRKRFGQEKFDIIICVPPTISGDLVRNFAVKLSGTLKIPISHELVKCRKTAEQKIFENSCLKTDNVRDAFSYNNPENIRGKKILLIDDVFDSGATIKEIGRYLTNLGAANIAPLVIAKTIGGDLHD